jgi:Flp pilus assembly protein TadG
MLHRLLLPWRKLPGDRRGTALTEFAIAFPVLLLLYVGTYTLSDALACNRKVTVTARALTDLATRYPALAPSDVSTILGASAQVMAPYPSNNAVIGLSEVKVADATHATVIWSQALNGAGLTAGTSVTIPTNMAATNAYMILGQVRYSYTPTANFTNTGTVVLSDSILMLPRVSAQVPLS